MVKTKWSIQDVREIFNELDKITGADSSKVEIKINGRLKRAIARYTHKTISRQPVKFDFSTDIMNVPSFQALKDTAIHEYCHFYCNSVLKVEEKEMGHGKKFKEACKLLGTDNFNPTCTKFISNQLVAARYEVNPTLLEMFEEETPVEELPVQEEETPTAEVEQPKEEVKEETPEEQPKQHKKGRLIAQYDLDGNFIKAEYRAYWKSLGMPMGNISKCANGKLKSCKGYVWKYLD